MKAKSTLTSFTRPVSTTHKRRCSPNTTSLNSTKRVKLDYAPAVYDHQAQPTSWYQLSEQYAPSGFVYVNHVDHQTIQPTNLYPSVFSQSYDANAYNQLCSEAPYDMTGFHQPCYVPNQLPNSIQSIPMKPKSMNVTNESIYVGDYVENRQCSEQQFDQFNYHNESPNITEPPPPLCLNIYEATKPTSSYRTSLSSTDEGYFSSGSPDSPCLENIDSLFTFC
uniref:Uncharacterized protein n=1 Tax=Ciona savignyi TaxID=51511 RepID=H2ZQH4_CIOSA